MPEQQTEEALEVELGGSMVRVEQISAALGQLNPQQFLVALRKIISFL